jgi:hypothetical protein
MNFSNFLRFGLIRLGILALLASLVTIAPAAANAFQIDELPEDQISARDQTQAKPAADSKDPDDERVTDTAKLGGRPAPLGKKFIRFHMWDGSIVGGDVTVDKIDIETEFGTLQVPIEKISMFLPGLNSVPKLNDRITLLVEGLGDKNFDVREKSHRELVAMGRQIQREIQRFDDGGSVERKKHLQEIKREIAEQSDEVDEFDPGTGEVALIRGDKIVTQDFSIVGKILQEEFRMSSKFGELAVNLSDIKMADRSFREVKTEIRKTIEVGGSAFFQNEPVSAKIRVNRGDKVLIRATGIVQWTNWSTSSGPDGIGSQGQWQGMNCGCLAARIGDSSKYIKIGTKGEFTAMQSGVLYLGVAMRDDYAKNSGYRWEGKYSAKVMVKPADKK